MKSCLIRVANGQQHAFRFSTALGFDRQLAKLHKKDIVTDEMYFDYNDWFRRGYNSVNIDGNIHFEVTELCSGQPKNSGGG